MPHSNRPRAALPAYPYCRPQIPMEQEVRGDMNLSISKDLGFDQKLQRKVRVRFEI